VRLSLEAAVQRYFALPAGEAGLVLEQLEPFVCRGGDWLFRQGDPADSMFLLARGRLQVWMEREGSDEPAKLVAEVEPGEIVGEVGMLSGGTRSASIRAVRDSLLLEMDSAAFDSLARQRPELMRHIAGAIATRLRERTAGPSAQRRGFQTVALLPLDDVASAEVLAGALSKSLGSHDKVAVLSAQRLGDLGAPSLPTSSEQEASPAMIEWLGRQEDEHRFVLCVADAGASAWSDLAVRHADLILLVGRGINSPEPRPWEKALLGNPRGPVARRALVLSHAGSPRKVQGTSAWLENRSLDFHIHLRDGAPQDVDRLARVLAGRAIGIVLGGGAARGFAHIGVYKALCEAGIPIDWIAGSSIGAVMGAGMATGIDPTEAVPWAHKAFVEGKPFGDITFPIVSFLRGRRMERLIAEHMSGQIEDLVLPFFCVSSNLGLGELQIHERGSLGRAIRASVSLPGVFPPAVIDRQLAVDGGILDNLPVDLMRGKPVGQVIAVDLTSRRSYEVDYETVPSPWAVLGGRAFRIGKRYRVPNTMSLMMMSMTIGTMAASKAAGERADLLIRPPVGKFSFTDVRQFHEVIEVGYEAAREAVAAWKRA
jgi:NTE family protein